MTKATNKPTHRVSYVLDRGENQKAKFTTIGAVWKHDKGEGSTFVLDVPLTLQAGDRLVAFPIDYSEQNSNS